MRDLLQIANLDESLASLLNLELRIERLLDLGEQGNLKSRVRLLNLNR